MNNEAKKHAPGEDVVIAVIVKARGIRGEVACLLRTDFPERLQGLKRVAVLMPDGERCSLEIEGHRFHNGRLIVKFSDFESMSAAERLVGGRLVVAEAPSGSLNEGEFYEYQLVGAKVVTTGGDKLGTVSSFIKTGGADVLVVHNERGHEHLIPFADSICVEVDLDAGEITVDPPEGLLEL